VDAILSGSTIDPSIEASAGAISRILPYIMAAERWQPRENKKCKKGHATLCGSTVCALVLCLQRLRRGSRHIIWRKSTRI
jgi:hypothetical protein